MPIISIEREPRHHQGLPRVSRYGRMPKKSNWVKRMSPRTSLSYITKGSGWISTKGIATSLEAPVAFVCPQGELVKYGPNSSWDEYCFSYDCEWSELAHLWGQEGDAALVWTIQSQRYVRGLCRQIELLLESTGLPGAADAVDGLAHALFLGSQMTEPDGAIDRSVQKIISVAQYWREHPNDERTHEQVARDVGLSAVHFRRLWHRHFGCSPAVWLTDVRMQQACEALESSGASIQSISRHLGYSSARNFAAVFRRHYDMSPSEWRALGHSIEPVIQT